MISFFLDRAKLFLFLKWLILLFTFDCGKKSRRLSIRFKRLGMVEKIFSLLALNAACKNTLYVWLEYNLQQDLFHHY